MESVSDAPTSTCSLERSVSQHSVASSRSRLSSRSARSTVLRAHRSNRRLLSQPPSSSASSIAASDKSLTSFPSFSPEPDDPHPPNDEERLKTATQDSEVNRSATIGSRCLSIVDTLTGKGLSRDALFQDAPLRQSVPGALHQASDKHIERLIARNGAVSLVRQISEDLAQRDGQIAMLRRRADERERALRKILRECGLSNMDLENRLKVVEAEMRSNEQKTTEDGRLSTLMSDAMQDTMATHAHNLTEGGESSTIHASTTDRQGSESGKGTLRAWKDYLWGGSTVRRSGSANSFNSDSNQSTLIVRSQSSMDRRPTLKEDLFTPPSSQVNAITSSRSSSVHSAALPERKASASLASLALRLVAGGAMTRDADSRGRAASASAQADSTRAGSAASIRSAQSTRAASGAVNPKALMAMRRISQIPQGGVTSPTSLKPPPQENWTSMASSPPDLPTKSRQESYGPVELDAILPPELQPPTLSYIHSTNNNYNNNNNNADGEFLTDRFGFIYDQRRKKRQREAAHVANQTKKSGRTEMLTNGRTPISPTLVNDAPGPESSVSSSSARPESLSSHEERPEVEEDKVKRWQDYLKIATFPTELLSHTPGMNASALEVHEGTGGTTLETEDELEPAKTPTITATSAGLFPPSASATTAVDNDTTQPSESEATVTSAVVAKEDVEPVKLLLEQLSEVHDSLQREKMVKWNDFLRKVRAERRREGQAAAAAAAAVAEARYETPAVITPEARVADGEIIGISGLGNKGKEGRAKWNEFKALVLGGIPVAYRAKIWSECSGANALRVPGYYDGLVAKNGDGDDDPAVVSQIQMDIHRTLTDNIFFRKGPGVQKLSELLLAYSRRNKDVGYCQGMNLIAANLLLIMPSAEDAFWILASIIEHILPQGYYDQSLMASRADQQVLRQFVSTVLPKVSAHLNSLSIELEALTFQWFLSVFTDCLCAEALFRVWDVVLCTNDGSTFLFQIALALLKLNERNLLKCDTPAGVYTYINHHMTEHAISIDGLVQAGDALRRVVRREDIEQRRNKAMQAERDLVEERDRARRQKEEDAAAAAAEAAQSSSSAREGEALTAAEPRLIEA